MKNNRLFGGILLISGTTIGAAMLALPVSKLPTAPPELAESSFQEEQTDIYYDCDVAD